MPAAPLNNKPPPAMSKQLTIRITDPTIIGGQPVALHSVHTVDEAEALIVIGAGRAEIHQPAAVVEAAAAPAAVPEAASAAPKPERKVRAPRA
jgi:hypothetical protein